jgi:hypothetical protein
MSESARPAADQSELLARLQHLRERFDEFRGRL